MGGGPRGMAGDRSDLDEVVPKCIASPRSRGAPPPPPRQSDVWHRAGADFLRRLVAARSLLRQNSGAEQAQA